MKCYMGIKRRTSLRGSFFYLHSAGNAYAPRWLDGLIIICEDKKTR